MTLTKREARRQRNAEDFKRATQQAVAEHPSHLKSLNKMGIPLAHVGKYAGNSLKDHLEDQMKIAVRSYKRKKEAGEPTNTARGIIRGLAIGILAYENSYSLGDPDAIKAIEKEFMNG